MANAQPAAPYARTTRRRRRGTRAGSPSRLHGVTPGNAEAERATPSRGPPNRSADYFPAQFTIRPAADESGEPIPTF